MKYTIIIDKDGEQLVFKGILLFLAEPGRIKMLREKWITVEDVEGLIIHEESDMSRLSDDEKRYFSDQVTMLKNENERLTDYIEELEEALSDKVIKTKGALLLMGKAENEYAQLNDESKYDSDLIAELSDEITQLESQIDAMRDFMALLYLGIREGRDEAFEALDEKTKHLINEVWFERLEEDSDDG